MIVSDLQRVLSHFGIQPNQLEAVDVLVLPENVLTAVDATELVDPDDSIYLAKHLKQTTVVCKTAFDLGIKPKAKHRRGGEFWFGVVWVLSEVGLPIVRDIIKTYITETCLRRKSASDPAEDSDTGARIHLELKMECGGQTSSIAIDGPASQCIQILNSLRKPSELLVQCPPALKSKSSSMPSSDA